MIKNFCSYIISKQLKEIGFDEKCFCQYNKDDIVDIVGVYKNSYFNYDDQVTAPLHQQVISWFETNHNLEIMIKSWIESKEIIYMFSVNKLGSPSNYDNKYVSKELAMDVAISRAIEIIKNKQI